MAVVDGERLRVSSGIVSTPMDFESCPVFRSLRSAMEAGRPVTGADAVFYTHEAAEATMMSRAMAGRAMTRAEIEVLYDASHAAALAKYKASPFSVYHPEVIQSMPGYWSEGWYSFWGLKHD